jgi:hypothetical protein
VIDQVSHPYKTRYKIILLYILFFKLLDNKLEYKWFCIEWFPDFNLLLIFSWTELWFVKLVPKYLNSFTLSIYTVGNNIYPSSQTTRHGAVINNIYSSTQCSAYTKKLRTLYLAKLWLTTMYIHIYIFLTF